MVRFIFLVLSLTLFAHAGNAQSNPEPERPKPVINIQEQPGTPLKISSVLTKWATPDQQSLELYVVVENVSDYEIRGYVWRVSTADGSEIKDPCFSQHSESYGGKILKPGESDGKSTWRRFPIDSPLPNLDLTMDFVVSANGTWGPDTCKTGPAKNH